MEKQYIAIDLKSFYASVECVERELDPLDACLVVADASRTEKTICLAVSPALKAMGIPGRPRLFEVTQRLREVNRDRARRAPGGRLTGRSSSAKELARDPSLGVELIIAPPRMAHYMETSRRVYRVYLEYVAPEDIHVYSVDEVFIDATPYLKTYGLTAQAFTVKLLAEVLRETGLTATAGIGTNLFLAKVAMDIVAKRAQPDEHGARMATLDERSFRTTLWTHRPLTDFWRIGPGIARKLEHMGLMTMGDVARFSLKGEEVLYRLFGVNAELIIDHAWGWEPCTIADIRAYQPESNSISSGQVLSKPYAFDKAKLVVREMTDSLVLDLVRKGLVTDQMVLTVGYDAENLTDPARRARYTGPVVGDHYGRPVPKSAHGTIRLPARSASSRLILEAVSALFDRIVDRDLLVRRMYVVAGNVVSEDTPAPADTGEQLDLFSDPAETGARAEREKAALAREKRVQKAVIGIRSKFGKNAILRGMDLEDGATARERNGQVGGHKA
ncbi:MAG: DNA methylase [Clostridia bacterium]|nr:DNA methylase [Clostridia bacterium]